MIFLFFLSLNVIPPHQLNTNIQRNILALGFYTVKDYCEDLSNQNFNENNKEFDYHTYAYCDKSTYTIEKANFSNIKMIGYSFSYYSYLIYSYKSNLNVKSCRMTDILFNDYLIYSEKEDYQSSLSSCYIKDCHERPGYEGMIYHSDCKQTSAINNTFYFSSIDQSSPIFEFTYHTKCKIIGIAIENVKCKDYSCVILGSNYGSDKIQFEDCYFKNIKGNNPSILNLKKLNYDLSIRNVTFDNCQNSYVDGDRPKGYFISIDAEIKDASLTLSDCKFLNLQSNSEGGGGIGLFFKSSNNDHQILTFERTIFENITHSDTIYGGGVFIFNKGQKKKELTNYNTDLTITDCNFSNINCLGKGGAIHFCADSRQIVITGSNFINTSSDDGHSIYISKEDSLMTTISYCTFLDCGSTKNTFAVLLDINYFEFLFNEIAFTYPDVSCGCINTNRTSQHTYKGNVFKNAKTESTGIINEYQYYDLESIIIENNTFDYISGQSQGRCIFIDFGNDAASLKIENNTIKNCPSGGILIKIVFDKSLTSFDFNLLNLIENTVSDYVDTEFNGSPQIVVYSKINDDLTLNFFNCFFQKNHSPKKGGAFQCGNNKYSGSTKVVFSNCQFIENTADEEGGAIVIQTFQGCQIEDCLFTKNCGKLGGDSLYIETELLYNGAVSSVTNHEISIKYCTFLDNGDNKENGIVSFNHVSNANIKIESCSFTDSKTNSFPIYVPSNIDSIFIYNCTIEYTNLDGRGGISITGSGTIDINWVNFISTSYQVPALKIESTDSVSGIRINQCSFDLCSGTDYSCFSIYVCTKSFIFEHNIIYNTERTVYNHYIGLIKFNNDDATLTMENISFINNTCSGLYEGGAGIQLIDVPKVIFNNCQFENNTAKQDKSQSRPTQTGHPPYYNGDGGGIQLGYYCKSNNMDVAFKKCTFQRNKAERHGGAIALQTLKTVLIYDCVFEDNEANVDFESNKELLVENHLYKKQEGRGGALYINPIYSYDDQTGICTSPDTKMISAQIESSKFKTNSAYDGYAIYIEGDDDPQVIFNISYNNFDDNFNPKNVIDGKIYGAVITSEMHSVQNEDIIDDNYFAYLTDIDVKKLSFVDHFGKTPTMEFTESDYFPSNFFSESIIFSNTDSFSQSKDFTNSYDFSKSNEFSKSALFTNSQKFDPSNYFSKSICFSASRTIINSNVEYITSIEESLNSNIDEFTSSNEESSNSNIDEFTSSNEESSNSNIDEFTSSSEVSSNNDADNSIYVSTNNDQNFISSTNNDVKDPTSNSNSEQPTNDATLTQTSQYQIFPSKVFERDPSSLHRSNKSINMSMIIGIAVGILVVIVVILLIIIFVIRKKKEHKSDDEQKQEEMCVEGYTTEITDEFENPLCNVRRIEVVNDPFEQILDEDDY